VNTAAAPVPHRLTQLDVFTSTALLGNPLAVVHDADDLPDATMAAFARWTNLSETTFLLAPTAPGADYRVRIFTPGGELPFAGHPTLGSCQAWLDAGGRPAGADEVVQQCALGLVRIRRDGARLAFAAPPSQRSTVAPALLAEVRNALALPADAVLAASWLDNGPQWLGLRLRSAEQLRGLTPDHSRLKHLAKVGLIAPQDRSAGPAGDTDFEVRAFASMIGVDEDPVTGSLNASLAQWLIASGDAPTSYAVAQGTAIGRRGRVHVRQDPADPATVWIGGDVASCISGTVLI
jgi:PhzF family phenazine biosynthesis protein